MFSSLFTAIMYIYILFWFCSFLGWLTEVFVFIVCDKKLVNRGFLIGPYCPLYGCGALIMLSISRYEDNLIVFFILAMVLCSVLEYLTSFLMESLFQIRWWDYSNDSFNINGRICLRNAIAFGALGVLFIKVIYPWYSSLIKLTDYKMLFIITLIILVITIIDILISFNAMSKIRSIIDKNIDKLKNKDATEDVNKMVNKKLIWGNFLQKRLIDTYHLLDKERKYLKKTIAKVNEKTKSGYGLFIIFVIVGVIVGVALSLYFNLGSLKIILPFTISISLLFASIILKVGNK